ncbi:MAG: DMT family transporter [Candidatus Hatepunaea meridiana]|nr:DMT family transporter [Candidatus Hatepunaea meridiana]
MRYIKSNHPVYSSSMLVLLCIIWGGTFPATKSALANTDPIHFLALRFSLAVIIVTPFILPKLKSGNTNSNADLKPLTVMLRGCWVGIFLFIGFALQTMGLHYTTASRSGFLTGMLVVMTPLLAKLFRTSRMPLTAWTGLPIAVIGVYFIADPESGGLNLGDWLTIACAFVFALQMVALEAVARNGKETWLLTYGQMLTVCLGAVIWSFVEGNSFSIDSTGWLAVIYTGLMGSIAAVWLQTRFQPMVPAGHAALIFTAEPVFASLFAYLLLGEVWSKHGFIGAALILVAMAVSSISMVSALRQEK